VRHRGWAALASAALCASVPHAGDAADDAKPFPVERSQILKSGGFYYVEGRVRIGKSTQIMVGKETKIVGRGEGGGVIELEGQLALVGVSDLHVVLSDVTIELQPKFGDLRTDMVDFVGKSAGVVSAPDKAVDGRVFLANTAFEGRATVDVVMSGNEIDLQRVDAPNPVHVRGVESTGVAANKVRVNLYNNCAASSGSANGRLTGGLLVEHVAVVEARTNSLSGDKVAFVDCGTVDFDGNNVHCKTLEFAQTVAGRFGRTSVTKCDLSCEKLVVAAPYVEGRLEKLSVDHCWFAGETKEKVVHEKFITDHADDPKCGVAVEITKLVDKPQKLAK
jgi:hypothetical protein